MPCKGRHYFPLLAIGFDACLLTRALPHNDELNHHLVAFTAALVASIPDSPATKALLHSVPRYHRCTLTSGG